MTFSQMAPACSGRVGQLGRSHGPEPPCASQCRCCSTRLGEVGWLALGWGVGLETAGWEGAGLAGGLVRVEVLGVQVRGPAVETSLDA